MSDSHDYADAGDRPDFRSDEQAGPRPITLARVLDVLTRGVVEEEYGMLPWGSNYAYVLSVSNGDVTVPAVYKPRRGERPLWDFPDGTLCYREVAAFVVSAALGWQIVPPTVLRGGPYGLGSIQFFVDHDPDINYFTPLPAHCQPQLQRIAAFDYLINNADRKGGHCLLDAQGHLWGIDHGLSFHHTPKLRTVIWEFAGQPVPESILADVRALCDSMGAPGSKVNQTMTTLLSAREVESLRARVERLVRGRRFPQPGAGPNYPWPPV
jgi:hypothetical protein